MGLFGADAYRFTCKLN